MEEALKLLGPWPLLQGLALGLVIAGIAVWAIRRGLQDSNTVATRSDEERYAERDAYKQLDRIEEHTEATVRLLERILEAFNRLNDMRWNRRQ